MLPGVREIEIGQDVPDVKRPTCSHAFLDNMLVMLRPLLEKEAGGVHVPRTDGSQMTATWRDLSLASATEDYLGCGLVMDDR
jgi:hypothetical protein